MLMTRKILFYLFLLMYCIFCPVLVLYSFGYILNPGDKQLSQTGLIHLETLPAGASIYLEGSRYAYKTPASITDLLSGRYKVTLKLKGYRSWSREIAIEKGKAAAFKNIFFLPLKLEPQVLLPQSIYQDLILLPETGFFILKTGPQIKDLFIFDWKKEELKPLLKDYASYADFGFSGIYPQKGGKKIIVFGGLPWSRKFYLIDWGGDAPGINDVTKLFDGAPDEFIWEAGYSNNAFAVYGNYVNRLDFENMSMYPRFIENIKGFGVSSGTLYCLGQDNRVLTIDIEKGQKTVLLEDEHFGNHLFSGSQFYKIDYLEDSILIFAVTNGELITTLPPYRILQNGLGGFHFYASVDELLYWKKNTIGIADFSAQDAKKSLFSGRIAARTVYEEGKNISQCFLVYNASHVIFKDANRVLLLELSSDEKNKPEYLVDVKNNTDILYCDETASLYYLDREGKINKLRIVPK